jgi:hypothetical protein
MDDAHSHGEEERRSHDHHDARRYHPGRNGGRHHPYRFVVYSILALILGLVIAGGCWWAYWNFYARFRPVTIAKNQAEIQKLLDQADWVSPGRTGAPIYLITFRACDVCTTYQREEFPKLAAAGVDTRVIVFARSDREGLSQSTPSERATVAELWINRDWRLYASWMATPRKEWTAPGVRSADGSFARTAVINASRDYIDQLAPLLKGAGVGDGFPLLIWRDKDMRLKACACFDQRSWHFIREDLGAPSKAPPPPVLPETAVTAPPAAPAPEPVPTEPPMVAAPPAASPPPAGADTPAAQAAPQASAPGATPPLAGAPQQADKAAGAAARVPAPARSAPRGDPKTVFY